MEVAGEIPAFDCDGCGGTYERYQLFPAGDGYNVVCEFCEEEKAGVPDKGQTGAKAGRFPMGEAPVVA